MSASAGTPAPPRSRWAHRHVLLVAVGLGIALLALVLIGGALAVFRYAPALDEARSLQTALESVVKRVADAGIEMDTLTLDTVEADLIAAEARLTTLQGLLAGDPLIGVARTLPPTSADVRGADAVAAAARDLLAAAEHGLAAGRRYVAVRDVHATGQATDSALADLVELMATSRDDVLAASAAVDRARATLDTVPAGIAGPIANARDTMLTRIDEYAPSLDVFVTVSERLPAMLGWDGERRYLVLTQDPAELRPTGGFLGSYGIVTFAGGELTGRSFHDTTPLDITRDFPRIEPPAALAAHVLDPGQPWLFADANWSPDYPTAAQDALRIYANESGDDRFDGVIAISTYTIDELLALTGPVAVEGFDATIAPGETTLTLLQLTREAPAPGVSRKAALPIFADALLDELLALPPARWGDLLGTARTLGEERHLLAWFRDDADQALVAETGFDGAVSDAEGDFVYAVDSNAAPETKLDACTSRNAELAVELDDTGGARHTMTTVWVNRIETDEGAPYRAMLGVGGRVLANYFRLIVPLGSDVEEVTIEGVARTTDLTEEAGRRVIGTYLQAPPGQTRLRATWSSPSVVTAAESSLTYRLTIQKEPGLRPAPLVVSVRVPDGYRITSASPELATDGTVARLSVTFDRDVVLEVTYSRSP